MRHVISALWNGMKIMSETPCNDKACEKRMNSHAGDIEKLYDTRVPWKTFAWTLTLLTALVLGSYKYTFGTGAEVRKDVKEVRETLHKVVTDDDMKEFKEAVIEAIKALK